MSSQKNNTLWFSSPLSSPMQGNPPEFGQHGVEPVASHMEQGPDLIKPLQNSELKWQCDKHGTNEGTSVYIRFDDGSFGHAQYVYSSIGLSPNCQLYWRYWSNPELTSTVTLSETVSNTGNYSKSSDKHKHIFTPAQAVDEQSFTANLSASNMKVSDGECSVSVTGCNNTGMTLKNHSAVDANPVYDMQMFPKDKGSGISLTLESLTPAVRIKSGKTMLQPHGQSSPYYTYHYFLPLIRVNGTLHLGKSKEKQVQGYASIIHGFQSTKPHLIATRWDMFQMIDAQSKSVILMLQMKSPRVFSRQVVCQTLVVRDGRLECCTTKSYIRHGQEGAVDPQNNYFIPKDVEFHIEGETVDKKSLEIKAKVETNTLTTKIDILAELPFLLRKVLQALIAKPFSYLWWDHGKAELEIGGQSSTFEGIIYHETTYVNPDK